ncbi:MAG: FAD-dependent oxidoreductase, partial [Nanoarchaeota archaeon]
MIKPTKFEIEVIGVFTLTPTVKNIRFKTPKDWGFEAGQYVSLTIPGEKPLRRSYSIASSPLHKEHIDICVKLVDNGPGSTFLHALKPGDKVAALGPLGHFVIKEKDLDRDKVFIATGTGIAPFRGMIPTLLKEGYEKEMTLLAGCRYEDEVLFADEFEKLADEHEQFHYHRIVSRPRDPTYGEKGRVQILIEKHVPKEFSGMFYLCGLWPMIEETVNILTARDIPKERIKYE